VEVAATAGGSVELDGVDDVGGDGALLRDVAREDGKDDVEVTSFTRDELLVLVDLATVVLRHVDDGEVVVTAVSQVVDLSFVGQPAASFGGDVEASARVAGLAHAGDTRRVGPVPLALLVEVTIELIGENLVADVAGGEAVTDVGTS